MTRLIIGLGNPGDEYRATRHNVGFRVVDELARRHGLTFRRGRWRSRECAGAVAGEPVRLLKPQTYMNESGVAVRAAVALHRLRPDDVLVVHDDIDMPLGRLRFRDGGSAGGNRGVRSIIDHLQTDRFWRLKIGIGRPVSEDPADYVLSPFDSDERAEAERAVIQAADAIEVAIQDGYAVAMNRYN